MTHAERIVKIKEREALATYGPWRWVTDPNYIGNYPAMPTLESPTNSICGFGVSEYNDGTDGWEPSNADQEFIAHSREDIRYLIHRLDVAEGLLHEYNSGHIGLKLGNRVDNYFNGLTID